MRRQLRTVKHPGILNDVLFKIVFATEAGKPILQALLNALLDLNGPQKIVSLELINPISEKEYIDEKGPILDLKARDNSGRQYNIEVQLNPGLGDYIQRSIYYTSKFYSEQIRRGESYDDLLKTISISLLDFNFFPKSKAVHSTFRLWEKDQDFAQLHHVELRKFSPSKPQELKTLRAMALHSQVCRPLQRQRGSTTRKSIPRGGNHHGLRIHAPSLCHRPGPSPDRGARESGKRRAEPDATLEG